jgi:hypothetical protein
MSDRQRVANGMLVDSLGAAIRNGEADLAAVPGLVCQLVDEDGGGPWKDFETQLGVHVTPRSFEEFVTTAPLKGLGCSSVDQLLGVCTEDPVARDRIDRATKRPHGGDHTSKIDNINLARVPGGTSEAAALRRLRKDRQDLHARVLAGELSAHAAMIEAGFRPKTVTVRVTDPESVARTLGKHMSPDDLAELARLLAGP